ncbi:MAG: DUF6145 family protein [Lachnospiraceae bacterium]|jgi:hypothetical protein
MNTNDKDKTDNNQPDSADQNQVKENTPDSSGSQYGMFDSSEGVVHGNIFKHKRGSIFWEGDAKPVGPDQVFGDADDSGSAGAAKPKESERQSAGPAESEKHTAKQAAAVRKTADQNSAPHQTAAPTESGENSAEQAAADQKTMAPRTAARAGSRENSAEQSAADQKTMVPRTAARAGSRGNSAEQSAEEQNTADQNTADQNTAERNSHSIVDKGNIVLCGSNSYNQKYYLNPAFKNLPDDIKKELQIMCVWFTEDVGGILTLEFRPDGTLILRTASDADDYLYDEIGAGMELSKMKKDRQELLNGLELYFRAAFLHQKIDWEAGDE